MKRKQRNHSAEFKAKVALAALRGDSKQKPDMEIWSGQDANEKVAQQALQNRARGNRAAHRSEYSAAMEIIDV